MMALRLIFAGNHCWIEGRKMIIFKDMRRNNFSGKGICKL